MRIYEKNDIIHSNGRGARKGMRKYFVLLISQFAFLFIISFLFYLLRPFAFIFSILFYIILPVISSVLGYQMVRKGLNPYLTIILPPISETCAGFLSAMGIGPDPLPIMITFFVTMIGAAAGDVINKTQKKGKK